MKPSKMKPISNLEGWTSIKLFTNNIRGVVSKMDSLKEVLDFVQPDIVNLSETLFKSKQKINIKNFVSFSQNRPEGKGGGVSLLVTKLVSNPMFQK